MSLLRSPYLPHWSILAPIFGVVSLWLYGVFADHPWYLSVMVVAGLIASVLAAVHHAEVIAHRVGEPYGSVLLAVAVTVIEVGLIISLMLDGGETTAALARDTVFAAVMLILNGIIGLCLLAGGTRHGEQRFTQSGVSASLATLAAIAVLTMVLPNFTTTTPGPMYSASQLVFIAVVSLVLYGTFMLVQTVRHREYFLPEVVEASSADADEHPGHHVDHDKPTNRQTATSAVMLLIALAAVVLLGKALSPLMTQGVAAIGAPAALVGVLIAAVVLMPESLAAVRAARANRLQTSLNLAIGSALACIGLTIPTVAVVALVNGWTLTLGLDAKSMVLLMLSLIVTTLSLGTGRTTVLQGVVHLVLLAVYIFTTIVP